MATNRLYVNNMSGTTPPLDVTPGGGRMGGVAKSGEPVVVGQIPGVLPSDLPSTGVGVVLTEGIFTLSVKGVNAGGNAAINEGDIIYFTAADAVPLSVKTAGVRFGYALQGVASGATASIPVRLGY